MPIRSIPIAHAEQLEHRHFLAAAAGEIDPSFVSGLDIADASNFFLAALPGGKSLLVAIETAVSGSPANRITLARFNADGLPDATFDGDGQRAHSFEPAIGGATRGIDVADDHLYAQVAGRLYRFRVSDGRLDTTFGGGDGSIGGVSAFDVNHEGLAAVITAGTSRVKRLTVAGNDDPSFSAPASFNLGGADLSPADDLLVLPSGKVLIEVVDRSADGDAPAAYLVRLNSDGSLDARYGRGGAAAIPGELNDPVIASLALQLDGSAVGVVRSHRTFPRDGLFRISPSGRVVTIFRTRDNYGIDPDHEIRKVAIAPDGSIVMIGFNRNTDVDQVPLARFAPDATPDMTFNFGRPIPYSFLFGDAAVTPDGRILLAAVTRDRQAIALHRLTEEQAGDNAVREFYGRNAIVYGTGGNDRIRLTRSGSALVVENNGDVIGTIPRPNRVFVEAKGGDDEVEIVGLVDLITVRGGGGNDLIDNRSRSRSQLFGDDGDDSILGGTRADTLDGGNGHDVIAGRGAGDRLFGNAGRDTISGEAGNDTIEGGAGDDELLGGSGDDELVGNSGNDRLFGHAGADALNGGSGDDQLTGGGGPDALFGQAGRDTYITRGDGAADSIGFIDGEDSLDGDGLDVIV